MSQSSNPEQQSNSSDSEPKKGSKIPPNVRVMIALVASPTLMVIAFSIYCLWIGNWQEPGMSGVIFSALGVFAYYLVFVGRLPKWFNFKRQN
ncbi:hypothetical protein [Aliiglaciecola lipolytica]|uniref:Uncharacterized protein n=1 Tax=Aliiglaciecola lipolytica E3 TaxID=1127673 RepID=K6YHY5_9ALTE|nr:hypothetical protein [Aliiglaciecola lipolytica]GAC16233.1 hypothetical protein GLIP_3622 [Aliiglaciecola lipolytica E3]